MGYFSWRRNQRTQREDDRRLGASARAINQALRLLEINVDTVTCKQRTDGMSLATPQDRADAITELILEDLPVLIRQTNQGVSGADADQLVFAVEFSAVHLALPPRVARFISQGTIWLRQEESAATSA